MEYKYRRIVAHSRGGTSIPPEWTICNAAIYLPFVDFEDLSCFASHSFNQSGLAASQTFSICSRDC